MRLNLRISPATFKSEMLVFSIVDNTSRLLNISRVCPPHIIFGDLQRAQERNKLLLLLRR
jgi:hypothetical protein